jgi:hypothetical protein
LFTGPKIGERCVAGVRRNAKRHTLTGAAPLETKDKAGTLSRTAVNMGINAKRTMIST